MPAPPVVAGYEVMGRLGKGRAVWLAEETVSGLRGRVVVRVGRPEAPEGLLQREIMALSLVRSPHVAAYRHCLRTADGACAVVTEYIAGAPLAAVLAGLPGGRLPWRPPPASDPGGAEPPGGVGAAGVMTGVLLGLAALHTADPPIVHRRLTPSNILVVGGTAVLTDLRLSALARGPARPGGGGPPQPSGRCRAARRGRAGT